MSAASGRDDALDEAAGDTFQTQRRIREALGRAGVRPRRALGQNFLIDRNLARIIVEASMVTPTTIVLEVGTGTGTLAGMLAERAARIVSVEIDEKLHAIACERLAGRANVRLVRANALRKNALVPEVVGALREEMEKEPEATVSLVSNLPFQIASPLLIAAAESELSFSRITCTVQREVAERITAVAGSAAYGLLTVFLQVHGRFRLLRVIPPTVFWPRPEVEGAILCGELTRELRARISDYAGFKALVQDAFAHRRKKLLNSLGARPRHGIDVGRVAAAMDQLGISRDARAQELPPETFVDLWNKALSIQGTQ
ncbi:MAG: 16S rRNA (adenine(1518)-N(6)/adenine(1519)-N(6))-dimethyltransferase RsmA [Planctomycetota bacterium]